MNPEKQYEEISPCGCNDCKCGLFSTEGDLCIYCRRGKHANRKD